MKRIKNPKRLAVLALTITCTSTTARAEETNDDESVGLDLSVEIASAYVFRGFNVFQEEGQNDQHAFVAPSVTWSVGETGLSLGYWGAYQIVGGNRSENTDAALNAEQDIIASYDIALTDNLTLSPGAIYYFYPFADEEVSGTNNPSIIEPVASISYATVVDLGLTVTYFYAIQGEIDGLRHIYLNPTVGKSTELGAAASLEVAAGFGYKRFDDDAIEDNIWDAVIHLGLPLDVGAGTSVTPAAHAAWTNIEDADFADEYVVWGGISMGYGL